MSAHAPTSQVELALISVGDRVIFAEDYLASVNDMAYGELCGAIGTVTELPHPGRRLAMVRVRWDGDDRDRLAAIDVLARVD